MRDDYAPTEIVETPFLKHIVRIPLLLLVATLVFSIGAHLIQARTQSLFILLFPRRVDAEVQLRAETRVVPVRGGRQQQIRRLVEELLLGPVAIEHLPIAPIDTMVELCIIYENRAYISLSPHILSELRFPLLPVQRIAAIEQSVRYNFRTLHDAIVLVDGNLPNAATPPNVQ